MPATPDDKFLTPSERLANLVQRMAADGFDVSAVQSESGLERLKDKYANLTLRKQQLEQAAFDATIAAINAKSIDVSKIDLRAWDDFQ